VTDQEAVIRESETASVVIRQILMTAEESALNTNVSVTSASIVQSEFRRALDALDALLAQFHALDKYVAALVAERDATAMVRDEANRLLNISQRELEQAEARADALQEALEFYADIDNWTRRRKPAVNDVGTIARAALADRGQE
jgi:hypothetical protein